MQTFCLISSTFRGSKRILSEQSTIIAQIVGVLEHALKHLKHQMQRGIVIGVSSMPCTVVFSARLRRVIFRVTDERLIRFKAPGCFLQFGATQRDFLLKSINELDIFRFHSL